MTNIKFWASKRKVWFQKNDDSKLGKRYMVYNEDEERHCRGMEEVRQCKRNMRQRGKKHIGYTEWGED